MIATGPAVDGTAVRRSRVGASSIDAALGRALSAIGYDGSSLAHGPALDDAALPGMRRLSSAFGLAAFERDVLLLALAPEVDDRYAAAFVALHRNATLVRPSVGLVLRLLADSIGARAADATVALSPSGRLFANQLVRAVGEGPHATRSLVLAPGVWRQLVEDRPGAAGAIEPIETIDRLVLAPTTRDAATRAVAVARARPSEAILFAIHGAGGRGALARAIAGALGHRVIALDPATLADGSRPAEIVRDARWWGAALVVEGVPAGELARLCAHAPVPVLACVAPEDVRALCGLAPRPVIELAIADLDDLGRRSLWQHFAQQLAPDDVARLAARFRFGPARIAATVSLAGGRAESRGQRVAFADVVEACRTDDVGAAGLARRLECPYGPDDLVVATATRRELELLESAARHGHRVFAPDGLGARVRGAGGAVALFAGPPGTGKTMGAQIIARRLELDLLRIDLSQVVNKYIGETEKHLDRVFREGEATGAILFFDEADALFGKRTEVRDAHDRYANLETAFLLQRLEQHRGVTILATNLKQNLDAAFMRRIQFVVDFCVPGSSERASIWKRHLVAEATDRDVDVDYLARFALAGGDIRNAVASAALLAVQRSAASIAMRDLVLGVWRELAKAGRLADADDFGGYLADVVTYSRG